MRGRVLDHALFDEDLQRRARHRAGQRVAAEGGAVLARIQHAEHLGIREHGRDRIEAAGERLADQGQVGLDALVLLGEQLAGAAKAGLDLVENQDHVVRGAELARRREIAGAAE